MEPPDILGAELRLLECGVLIQPNLSRGLVCEIEAYPLTEFAAKYDWSLEEKLRGHKASGWVPRPQSL